jgi:hypothetical protein
MKAVNKKTNFLKKGAIEQLKVSINEKMSDLADLVMRYEQIRQKRLRNYFKKLNLH